MPVNPGSKWPGSILQRMRRRNRLTASSVTLSQFMVVNLYLSTIFFLSGRTKTERAEHHALAASLCALATDLVNGRGAITTGRRTRGAGRAAAKAGAAAAKAGT